MAFSGCVFRGQHVGPKLTYRAHGNHLDGFARVAVSIPGPHRLVRLTPDDQPVRVGPKVLRAAVRRLAGLDVDTYICPANPHAAGSRFQDVDEAVTLLSSPIVEQFRPTFVAFEELIREPGS